jgi:predicted transcriptional regulator YdeE
MNYKIEQMDAFTVYGVERSFQMDNSLSEIPKFWDEFFYEGLQQQVCPMFGICFDANERGEFSYVIGDSLKEGAAVPEE